MDSLTDLFSDRLPELLRVLQESDVRALEIREGIWQVKLIRAPAKTVDGLSLASFGEVIESAAEPETTRITSPSVGTFFRAGAANTEPLVKEGSDVEPHTIVGILESLHDLTDVEAGCDGSISAVLATDGQPVEYGQVLFEVETRG